MPRTQTSRQPRRPATSAPGSRLSCHYCKRGATTLLLYPYDDPPSWKLACGYHGRRWDAYRVELFTPGGLIDELDDWQVHFRERKEPDTYHELLTNLLSSPSGEVVSRAARRPRR